MAKKAAPKASVPRNVKAKPTAKTAKPKAQPKKKPLTSATSVRGSKKQGRLKQAQIAKDIEILKKRNRILDLKESGASIRQISELLIREKTQELMAANPELAFDAAEIEAKDGNSPTRVHQLLCEALDDLHQNQLLNTKRHVSLELSKLEKQELALHTNAIRFADLDKNLLKEIEDCLKRNDQRKLARVLKFREFHSDDVEKYSRSLDRIWKRRDSLLGLNKPVKHEHTGEDGKPIETKIVTRVILPTAPELLNEEEDDDAG